MNSKIKITDKLFSISELRKHESFCVLPWSHFHVWPEGDIYPCCRADFSNPIGKFSGQTMNEVMNSENFKKMRLDMLNGIKPHEYCSFCYKHEKDYNNAESPRLHQNSLFLDDGKIDKDLIKILESTTSEGEIDFQMLYVDIRFSNICNLKCRSCSGSLSSSIAAEDFANGKMLNNAVYGKNGIIKVESHLIAELLENSNADKIKRVYFAGGEPLITEEHYEVLLKIIERKNTNINILYNTNFTSLKYKGVSILEYWKQFPNLNVGTSIDDIGNRLGYLRNGAKWEIIKDNFKQFFEVIPDGQRKIYNSITVSVFNVLYLDEIISTFLNEIKVSSVQLQLVFGPEMMCVTSLPGHAKKIISEKLTKYSVSFLTGDGNAELRRQLRYVLEVMNGKDTSNLIPHLASHTYNHDFIRKENFLQTYPELEQLINLSSHFPK